MERIMTSFLKKEEIIRGNVTEVLAVELVKNRNEIYYVFENSLCGRTGNYSKTEILKVWMDEELARDMYNLSLENKTSKGYTFVEDGDNLYGLAHMLDYTQEYVDSDNAVAPGRPNTQKIVFTEQHRKLEA